MSSARSVEDLPPAFKEWTELRGPALPNVIGVDHRLDFRGKAFQVQGLLSACATVADQTSFASLFFPSLV